MNPFNIQCDAQVSARGAQRLRHGHLWVYASDVARGAGDPAAPLVRVLDPAGNPLGYAFHSAPSQIRLRLITRGEQVPTPELIRDRLQAAIGRRPPFAAGGAARLVFSEADLLPSVIVDRYDDCLALQTLSRGADAMKGLLVDTLRELLSPRAIVERNDVRARVLEGLEEKRGVLFGPLPEPVAIDEHGIRFLVDIAAGQKTGFFLDQQDNRRAAARHASGRALDCFTNTGGFALHFARRCNSVLAVDASEDALAQGRRNADLNGAANVRFHEANVFDFLREMERAGERFDTICLDPPAFAKNRGAVAGAKAGYKEINLRAMKLLRPDGILATCSCSYHLAEAEFAELLQDASCDAHRYAQILERRGQAEDHPVLVTMPETGYLKCFILRVM